MKNIILYTVLFLALIGIPTGVAAVNPDIEIIRQRILAELIESKVDDDVISALVHTIKEDGSWPGINYVDVSRIGYDQVRHVSNLYLLAVGYKKPESSFYRNTAVLKVIQSAVDFWTKNDFIADNWHTNEIGNPMSLTRILLLMDGELTERQTTELTRLAQRANLDAWGARPGGDLIKIAGIMAEMAICKNDEAALKKALEAISAQIKITTGLGIKSDLGFHHRTDRVTSILAYGTSYATTFADWAVRLAGTPFSFPQEPMKLIIDYYLEGICKSMVHAWYKAPGIMNRGMSRKGALDAADAEMPGKLLMVSDYRKQELENIVKIRTGKQRPNLTYNKFFWHSEYAIHQRPGYHTTVRMFSDRNHTMEAPHNEESLKMHHYADGANFISVTGKEYFDIYPVWDWQKIPGTTIVQKPVLPHWNQIVKKGKTDFVGAVSDGLYGAATFDFDSPHDPLTAKKAWFFFDNEYVCLGAGIKSSAGFPVATTLNQCLLKGDVIVQSGNEKKTLSKGDHQVKAVSWVLHDGVAYIFPKQTNVSLNNRAYSGSWHSIVNSTRTSRADEETKELFSLWIDHGLKPENASYEYIVAPGAAISGINPEKVSSKLKVLSNTSELQAVQNQELNITQIVFYQPGKMAISDDITITASAPCIVLIKSSEQNIEQITVADPTRKLHSIQLGITSGFTGSTASWKAKWNKKEKTSDIFISLPTAADAGKSIIMRNNTIEPEIASEALTMQKEKVKVGHYIGELYGGGMVIWVDETGEHGLIAALKDQSNGIQWRNGPSEKSRHFGDHHDRVVNARGNGIGAGEMNTTLIIAQLTDDDIAGNFAAKVCANCETDGYGDWYLPSKAELELLYQLKEKIGGFENDMYWSSTEFNVGFCWVQNFNGYGGQYTQNKSSAFAVRCVRRF